MADYVHDAIDDYGAPTDGSDFASAAIAWNDFIATMTPSDTLTVTLRNAANGGSNDWYLDNASNAGLCFGALGGRTVKFVIQDGITLHGGGSFNLARNIATNDNNTSSSRVDTVEIGQDYIILKTPSEHTRYSIGQWISLGAVDTIGFGSPHSPRIYDHLQIASKDVDVATNGRMNLSGPATNRYLDTLPVSNAGDGFHPDCGGPATIWLFLETYDLDITFELGANVLIQRDDLGLIYCKARKVTVNAPASSGFGGLGLCPTIAQGFNLNGGFISNANGTEVDKVIGTLNSNGASWFDVHVQTGIGEGHFIDTTVTHHFQLMRKTYIEGGCDLQGDFWAGPTSYAWCDELHIRGNNTIAGPFHRSNMGYLISDWEWIGGGVFRGLKSEIPAENGLLFPGGWWYFSGTRHYGKPFQVVNVTYDETYFYSHTTLSEYPTFDFGQFSDDFAVTHFRNVTCLKVYSEGGVTTSDDAISALNDYPWGRPLEEYTLKNITGAHDGATDLSFPVNGQSMLVEIDVSRAYTGAQSTCRLQLGQFGFFMMNGTTIARPQGLYVDLKQTGTRHITPSGVTGAAGTDNLTTINGWHMANFPLMVTADTTGDTSEQQAIAQVRVRTNMGPPLQRTFTCNFV